MVSHKTEFKPAKYKTQLIPILKKIEAAAKLDTNTLNQILNKYPKDGSGYFSKSELISAYRIYAGKSGLKPYNDKLIERIKMKPVRTISGVTPITVLTKPYPCPGTCIFCPNDIRMPKSYLSDEPGAQRAAKNNFDPYLQTYNRLSAYQAIGHKVDKVELIVLGGTWSFYPEKYQIWFIKRLFQALNDFSTNNDQRHSIKQLKVTGKKVVPTKLKLISVKDFTTYNQAINTQYDLDNPNEVSTWEELEAEHTINQISAVRCVGLVLETRPDHISEKEVIRLRRLGATKTQIGLQSLQDEVLAVNKRGHDVAASRKAVKLLRQGGFKIHAHWMPNLYGSSVEKDKQDYRKLFSDPDFMPDELKIYPCSLIDNTPLVEKYQKGEWQPYSDQELLEVLSFCLTHTPEYTRLTRVIRDIGSQDIMVGNKKTNFRQIAENYIQKSGGELKDIRSREVKQLKIKSTDLKLDIITYETSVSTEHFLQYITKKDHKIAGFLRLSLPKQKPFIKELKDSAAIREVHVYGTVVGIGDKKLGAAQHLGLGKKLIAKAENIAKQQGFKKIAVISAIGTREYYQKLGYSLNNLYQHKKLN